MWEIRSKTWGALKAHHVYDSVTFSGMVTAHDVTRDGKLMWSKVYIPVSDTTAIIPPKELS